MAELTDRTLIQYVNKTQRAQAVFLWAFRNQIGSIQEQELINQTIQPLLDAAADDDTIPNTSGLAGSQDMEVADVKQLFALWDSIVRSMDKNQTLTALVRSAGVENTPR